MFPAAVHKFVPKIKVRDATVDRWQIIKLSKQKQKLWKIAKNQQV
jgi:hypothetical protein